MSRDMQFWDFLDECDMRDMQIEYQKLRDIRDMCDIHTTFLDPCDSRDRGDMSDICFDF